MAIPTGNNLFRLEAPTSTTGLPPVGSKPVFQILPPTSVEHIMMMLRKLDARLGERDARDGANPTPSRPDPDPPYGMPRFWQFAAWVLGGSSVASVEPTYSTMPWIPFSVPFLIAASGFGERPPLRFRQPPSMPQHFSHQQPYSSWDVALPRSVWDQTHHRHQPSSSASDPTRLIKMDPPIFDGTEAHSWITRV